jgi:hypothetical protein
MGDPVCLLFIFLCYNVSNSMDDQTPDIPAFKNTGLIAGGISIVIIALIILQHNLSFKGTIVLPAGGTYLGPSETTTQAPTAPPALPSVASAKEGQPLPTTPSPGKFTVAGNATWINVSGRIYPYSFQSPKSLSLVTFPNDQFDIYAISWNNHPPDQNVLIGVDNLKRTDNLKQYINVSKRGYVENWWKQFGLTGVSSITEFTNSNNLKGYRAKYKTAAGLSPNDDIFFETPDPALVIHLASGVLDSSVFNLIIDTVAWKK